MAEDGRSANGNKDVGGLADCGRFAAFVSRCARGVAVPLVLVDGNIATCFIGVATAGAWYERGFRTELIGRSACDRCTTCASALFTKGARWAYQEQHSGRTAAAECSRALGERPLAPLHPLEHFVALDFGMGAGQSSQAAAEHVAQAAAPAGSQSIAYGDQLPSEGPPSSQTDEAHFDDFARDPIAMHMAANDEEFEAKERLRAREVWERDRQRLARRQREAAEREAKAEKRAAHLGRDGAARLERMMAFRRAKGLGGSSRVPPPRRGTQGTREEPRRLQERERDLDEEKNVCIEGREVLAGMTRGVG